MGDFYSQHHEMITSMADLETLKVAKKHIDFNVSTIGTKKEEVEAHLRLRSELFVGLLPTNLNWRFHE